MVNGWDRVSGVSGAGSEIRGDGLQVLQAGGTSSRVDPVGDGRSVSHPFDVAAGDYDAQFTHTCLGRWLRASVWKHLERVFRPGARVLELGCGTGEDAVWLTRRGVHVLATDASPAMLKRAYRKAEVAGVGGRVSFKRLNLSDIDEAKPEPDLNSLVPELYPSSPAFDGGVSNFGVLNCIPDRRPIAQWMARRIRRGGRVVLVVMGPFCLWEVVWHLLHGEVEMAFRRLRSGVDANIDNQRIRVWYPSPRRLRVEFAPYFRPVKTVGIGVLLPPTYLSHLVDRHPRWFEQLARLDRWVGRFCPGPWLSDHYLMIVERR